MSRLLLLAALALGLVACDAAGPDSAAAEVTVGATYHATEMAFRNADSGDLVFNFLAAGSDISFTFDDASHFRAQMSVPEAALRAAGETNDVEGGFYAEITGTYTQTDGALAFTADPWVDSLFDDSGWTIDLGGQAARYSSYANPGVDISIVLTRR